MYDDYYSTFFEAGADAAIQTAESWDEIWQIVYGGSSPGGQLLYVSMVNIGQFFAVGTMIVMVIMMIRNYQQSKGEWSFEGLFWALVIGTVLANNGQLLADFTLGMRNVINTANQQVLTTTLAGINLNETYREANGLGGIEQQISALVQECATKNGDALAQCLESAQIKAEELIAEYEQINGGNAWLDKLKANLADIFADGIIGGTVNLLFAGLLSTLFSYIAPILLLMQICYQHLLEVSLILTGMLGPIAVGSSLLPIGAKPVFAWITAFFSVGIAKLSFNLVVGLTSIVATGNDLGNPGWFPLFCAVFAPLLSAGLAAGGGLAVWQGITSGVASISSAMVKVAGAFI